MHTFNILPATLLIVDDIPENISVLFNFLNSYGFELLIAENGEDALETAQNEQPDLILLDVIMPGGIDGFETCRQLKNNPQTQDIPVIFMTALSDLLDKVKGFELGAVDYVTKPFQQEEVLARIKTHLTIRKLQKELQTKNEQLIQLNQEKNEFLGIAAHDLKNPLSSIQTLAEFLNESIHSASYKQDVIRIANIISSSSKQMFLLIKNLLDINAIESGKRNLSLLVVNLLPTVQSLVTHYAEQAKMKDITVGFQCQEQLCLAVVDKNAVQQVLDNLISNAIKYSPHGKQVYVRLTLSDNSVRCEIQDEGPGLSESDQQKLFGKFTRLTAKPTGNELSTGLGLFIVKKLVNAMNGKVWCESELGQGATFIVEFPRSSN